MSGNMSPPMRRLPVLSCSGVNGPEGRPPADSPRTPRVASWCSPSPPMLERGSWMALRSNGHAVDVTPSARRLTDSLRHIGYEFVTAVADLVDNSVAADARNVDLDIQFDGARSLVMIADDGVGMTKRELNEALRFGTRRSYGRGDLGRFGLGLKTASISQCRRLTVVTRHSPVQARITTRCLDLDYISRTD